MDGYRQIPLTQYLSAMREDSTQSDNSLIPPFSCPLNPDIEDFLKHKAAEFDRQSISRTFLVFASYKDVPVLVGYYTLANKVIVIRQRNVSSRMWKRVQKFGSVSAENKTCCISAPLIGQLGKNFENGYNTLITGSELLQMAIDQIRITQNILGGKIIYLECEDDPHLIEFYNKNQFYEFDRRRKDKDEENLLGDTLVQMLCYL